MQIFLLHYKFTMHENITSQKKKKKVWRERKKTRITWGKEEGSHYVDRNDKFDRANECEPLDLHRTKPLPHSLREEEGSNQPRSVVGLFAFACALTFFSPNLDSSAMAAATVAAEISALPEPRGPLRRLCGDLARRVRLLAPLLDDPSSSASSSSAPLADALRAARDLLQSVHHGSKIYQVPQFPASPPLLLLPSPLGSGDSSIHLIQFPPDQHHTGHARPGRSPPRIRRREQADPGGAGRASLPHL